MLNRPFTKSKNSLSKQGFVQNLSRENEFHFICTRIEIIIFIAMVSHGLLSLWKSSGGSRGGHPPPPPPPYFSTKIFSQFFGDPPPPLSQGLDDRPPSPLSEGLDPPLKRDLRKLGNRLLAKTCGSRKCNLNLLSQKNATCSNSYPPVALLKQNFGVIYNKRCNFSYPNFSP